MASKSIRKDDLIFRPRGAQDDRGLLELFNEENFLHNASVRAPFASCAEMRIWLDGIAAAKRFEIVAVSNGEIVGFAGLYTMADAQSHLGWVILGVRKTFQGRGIGAALMHMLIATARVFVGLQRLQLTVFSDNQAAMRLYRKFGFEIEGRHRRFVRRGADFVDAFTMALLFDDGEAARPDAETLPQLRRARAVSSPDHRGRWVAA